MKNENCGKIRNQRVGTFVWSAIVTTKIGVRIFSKFFNLIRNEFSANLILTRLKKKCY